MGSLVELGGGAVGIDAGAQVVRGAREARSGQNLAVDLVTGVAGGDAHDDARDRIVRLRLAAADRILAVGDLRARIAQLGREFVAPLRIDRKSTRLNSSH